MAIPGSRSGNRNEGQGYPRPNPNRTNSAPPRSANPYRRPSEEADERPLRPAPASSVPLQPSSSAPPSSRVGSLLTDEVRELINLMAASDLTEINIEMGTQKILIKREPARIVMPEYAAPPARESHRNSPPTSSKTVEEVPHSPDPGAPPENSFHKITAPMVGTYYRGLDPKAKPFIQEGDMVEKGQVIGIIEAMKIMNEIQSEHTGRCLRVVVENGQPVEYGQTLLVLEPV